MMKMSSRPPRTQLTMIRAVLYPKQIHVGPVWIKLSFWYIFRCNMLKCSMASLCRVDETYFAPQTTLHFQLPLKQSIQFQFITSHMKFIKKISYIGLLSNGSEVHFWPLRHLLLALINRYIDLCSDIYNIVCYHHLLCHTPVHSMFHLSSHICKSLEG